MAVKEEMNVQDFLSDDGLAMVALCSGFGLKDRRADANVEPLKLTEWNQLEKQLGSSSIKNASSLQGWSSDALAKELAVSSSEAERVCRLLERSSRLALELENLFSHGVWTVTRADQFYPSALRDTLKHQAPTVLFGAGETNLFRKRGIAVVGSRNIDPAGAAFAREIGSKIAASDLPVVSGGARGSDRFGMDGALMGGGKAVGVLADSLEATVRKSDVRELLLEGQLVLITPYAPQAGFSVGGAMGRNKLIYALSEFAMVVSSDFQTGGTWAGALEALKGGWCPVWTRQGSDVPRGNRELLKLGALPFPEAELSNIDHLASWLRTKAPSRPTELDLF